MSEREIIPTLADYVATHGKVEVGAMIVVGDEQYRVESVGVGREFCRLRRVSLDGRSGEVLIVEQDDPKGPDVKCKVGERANAVLTRSEGNAVPYTVESA